MRIARIRGRGACALVIAAAGLAAIAPSSLAASRGSSTIWTIAGVGSACSSPPVCADGGPATSAQLNFPQGLTVDAAGNVYVVDWGDQEIRKLAPNGTISIFAGDGMACSSPPACGDGGPATSAELNFPEGVVVDGKGNVYIADTGDNEVRKVGSDGTISRVAGDGTACATAPSCGDGGAGTSAQLESPGGVAVDGKGNVYIADTGDNEVRKLALDGTISLVAGDGTACAHTPSCGDGRSPLSAQLNLPQAVAVGRTGRLLIADNGDNEVRAVSRGTITRLAGDGTTCATAGCGDGGSATRAQLDFPEGVAVDRFGTVYILDWGDSEVRAVSKRGVITTIAGTGAACTSPPSCGDGGAAASARLNFPEGLALDASGALYIGDTYDHEVRWMAAPNLRAASLQGQAELLAFGALVSSSRVTVRYALAQPALVTLTVTGPGGVSAAAAQATGSAGWNGISWNRRLGGRRARHGRYKLTVAIAIGGSVASSSVRVRL